MSRSLEIFPGATISVKGTTLHDGPIETVGLHGGEFDVHGMYEYLTDTQVKIFALFALGLTRSKTSATMYLHDSTVKYHREKIADILDAPIFIAAIQPAFDREGSIIITQEIDDSPPLSPEQKAAIEATSRGMTKPEIAKTTFRSPHTVKNHLDDARIRLKGARNMTEAVTVAHLNGEINSLAYTTRMLEISRESESPYTISG